MQDFVCPLKPFVKLAKSSPQKCSMTQATSRTGGRTDFATEADFVDCFVGKLSKGRTSFGKVQITKE